MEKLISVIIPVYNTGTYIGKCLDSVLNTAYQNLEVLCVDDGSTDDSPAILRAYAEQDPRIVVISKTNGGVSSARNAGLERATGEFIAFLDSDDYIHPQYFSLLMEAQQMTNGDLIACEFELTTNHDPRGSEIKNLNPSCIRQFDCRSFFDNDLLRCYCCCRIIRRRILNGIRFHENLHWAEDSLFIAEMWEKTPDVRCFLLPEKLYYYYQRPGSLEHSATGLDKQTIALLFLEKARQSKQNEQIYLRQAVRRAAGYRQEYLFSNSKVSEIIVAALRKMLPLILKSHMYTPREKMKISIKALVPNWAYRIKRRRSRSG